MGLPPNETLTIRQWSLKHKDNSIFRNSYNISSTRRSYYTCDLFSMYIESLLNNIIERRVKQFDTSILSPSKHSWDIPLAVHPT